MKKQSYMLDDIGEKMEKVNNKMDNTIKNLKKTNEENSRGGDKLCMDMICLILLLGTGYISHPSLTITPVL